MPHSMRVSIHIEVDVDRAFRSGYESGKGKYDGGEPNVDNLFSPTCCSCAGGKMAQNVNKNFEYILDTYLQYI